MFDWLFNRLATFGDADAVCDHGGRLSYKELLSKTDQWLALFDEKGVRPGMVVSVEGNWSGETVSLALALLKRGCIYVPIGLEATPREVERYKEIASVQAEISFRDPEFSIKLPERSIDNPLMESQCEKQRAGLVIYSSGSTGDAKGMLHDLEPLLEKYKKQRSPSRMVIFLAFDHIGGINTFYHILSNGGSLIVPEGRRPQQVCRVIEDFQAEVLPTSPSFLNLLLLSREYENYDLSSLKLITYGTEVMPENTLQETVVAFPGVKMQQTYGLSEIGILRSKSKSSDSKFVKVGGEGYQLKIVDNQLWIKADAAMLGYLNAKNPFDENRWFPTGDLVEQDGEYIRFLGRESDQINVGGEKVFPAEVESTLLEIPEVKDATVLGEPHSLLGNMVVARITPITPGMKASEMKKLIRRFCKKRLAPFKIPAKVVMVEEDQFNYRFKKKRSGGLQSGGDDE